jgi:hypothetical protein
MQMTLRRIVRPPRHQSRFSNVFHCTTQKAGSRWVSKVLGDPRVWTYSGLLAYDYEATLPKGYDTRPINEKWVSRAFPRGCIVTPLYWGYQPYADLEKPRDSKALFILRDPRDIVVSQYFSMRYSHVMMDGLEPVRQRLAGMSQTEGLRDTLVSLAEYGIFSCQRSWLDASGSDQSVLVVRYEDLIDESDPRGWKSLFRQLDIQLPETVLDALIRENRFESLTGRRRGQEDTHAHLRKGIHGDWKNYFDDEMVAKFKAVTADLVVLGGYESNTGWEFKL